MKPQALRHFRRKLESHEALCGLSITLEAPAVTDIAAGLGLDWIMIDSERGSLDWGDVREHVTATVRSDTVALVRLSDTSPEMIKWAMNLGADGIAIPGIRTPIQLESIANEVHNFTRNAINSDTEALVVPIIDPRSLDGNALDYLSVKGTQLFLFELQDASQLYGSPTRESLLIKSELQKFIPEFRRLNKHAGIIASNIELLQNCRDSGFDALGVNSDDFLIRSGIRDRLASVGREGNSDRQPAADRRPFSKGFSIIQQREAKDES